MSPGKQILIQLINSTENNNNRNMIFPHPLLHQKKTVNSANNILKFESTVKLLTATSLYTPSIKPIRSTKSELKSNKGFHNLTDPLTFPKVCDKKPHRREQKINFIALDTAETVFKQKKPGVKKQQGNLVKKCENKQEKQVINKENRSNLDYIESEVEICTTNFITLSSHKIDTVLPINLKPLPSRPSSVKFDRKPPPFCSTKMETSIITTPHIKYDTIKIKNETRQSYKTISSNEFSCQVSTLSRKILQYSPEEITKNLSQLSNKNKLTINPSNTNSNYSNISKNKINDTKVLKNKASKTYTAIGGYSYCNIRKAHFNNHKLPEDNLCVDKFGIKSKPEFSDIGYTRMINFLDTKTEARNKKHDVLDIQNFSL